MKYLKPVIALLLAALFAFGAAACVNGGGTDDPKTTTAPADTPTEVPAENPTEAPTEEPTPEVKKGFDLHFIDIGTGDGMLLVCDGEAMVIDSGNVGRGEKMVSYIKAQGVTELKYIMVTHGHADHVGGMPEIIEAFPFETMFINLEQRCTEKPFKNLLSIIEERKINTVNPEVGAVYTLGGGSFKVIGPLKDDPNNLNNCSICIKFTYGENTFLLCADISATVESQLLKSGEDLTADVFKADHHGSSAGNVKKFLSTVNPKYICMQVGTENKLGYPDKSTVKRLEQTGAEFYRNDVHGDVVMHSDGKTITVTTEKVPEAAENS
ncbi:MAG: MBL fold metallo-hydrolase [Clostridia bacterium]|nr:MBL fold metallo-hydrolase [Clostridia bacterium]